VVYYKENLEISLPNAGIDYNWAEKTLGGFSKIDEGDIKELAAWQKDRVACSMCMQADPYRCHRKTDLAKRLKKYGISVNHIELE